MVRKTVRDLSVDLLITSQEVHGYESDFEPRHNMTEFEILDAVDLAATTTIIPEIFSKTTAGLVDNAFPE